MLVKQGEVAPDGGAVVFVHVLVAHHIDHVLHIAYQRRPT